MILMLWWGYEGGEGRDEVVRWNAGLIEVKAWGRDEWPIRGDVSRAVRVGRGNEAVRSDIVGISGVGVSTARNYDA